MVGSLDAAPFNLKGFAAPLHGAGDPTVWDQGLGKMFRAIGLLQPDTDCIRLAIVR